ncbi:MAG TPA: ABC transporter permease [Gaiellaceae bacterium]|jgi:lipopolysaccharide transport system permease protein|nr:ABC transporter permease [Gaiellaceae bacterium]
MSETQLKSPAQPGSAPEYVPERGTRADYVTVIQPPSRWPHLDVPELWRFRELLGVFVWRDLKVRYKQTVIGAGWALLQPVLPTIVFTVVFGFFAKFPTDHLPYPIFAFASVVVLQYFTSALTMSSGSLVANVGLITKVYFPRLLLPLGAVVTPLVDLTLGVTLLAIGMAWYDIWPGAIVLLAPLFIVLAFATALGTGLILSALNVRYRDVPYVIPVFLQLLPYASGVIFAVSSVPVKWQWLMAFNPLTTAIAGWRWVVIDGQPPNVAQACVGVAMAALILLSGFAFFKRAEPKFADTI